MDFWYKDFSIINAEFLLKTLNDISGFVTCKVLFFITFLIQDVLSINQNDTWRSGNNSESAKVI